MRGLGKKITSWFKSHFFTKTEVVETETLRIIPKGHIVFKYNIGSKTLSQATCRIIEDKKTVYLQPGCMYVSGLNKAVAIKKLGVRGLKVILSAEVRGLKSQPKGTDIYFKQAPDFNTNGIGKHKVKNFENMGM